jgi:GNAT superfamily N-acetyltransferase
LNEIRWPTGFAIEQLDRRHRRSSFDSGVSQVDQWLEQKARQSQTKRLSVTRHLVGQDRTVAGFYTLALGQLSFDELPHEVARKLPSTLVPILTLAWLGLDRRYQGRGLGGRLLAQALSDCHRTGQIMPFMAVLIDCVDAEAKSFYEHYGFRELPGYPMKLMLPWKLLDAMMGK